jgi:hypothetical protein
VNGLIDFGWQPSERRKHMRQPNRGVAVPGFGMVHRYFASVDLEQFAFWQCNVSTEVGIKVNS